MARWLVCVLVLYVLGRAKIPINGIAVEEASCVLCAMCYALWMAARL